MSKLELIEIIKEEVERVLLEQEPSRSSGAALTNTNIPDWSEKTARSHQAQTASSNRLRAKKDNQDIIQQIYSQAGRSGALNRELSIKSDGKNYDFKVFNHKGSAAVQVSGNSFKVSEASSGRSPEIDLIETDGNMIKITGSWGVFSDSILIPDSVMKDFLKAIAKLRPGKASLVDFAGLQVKLDPIS